MAAELERDVTTLARVIAELGAGERSKVFRMSWWSERMLDWAMARPAFKTQLFRFVDVFPALDERRRRRPPPRRVLRRRRRAEGARPRHRRRRARAVRRRPRGPGRPARTSPAWPSSSSSGRPPAEAVDGPARAVAAGQRGHRRPARREDDRRPPRPTATRPGSSSCSTRSGRRGAGVGARRPPRARRPRPAAAGQRQHQADRAGDALRAADPRGGPRRAPRSGSARSCGSPASAARTSTSTWSTPTPRT